MSTVRPFLFVCGSRFTKMAAFDLPITLESHGIAVALLSQRGNSQAGENAMRIERATKLLKRFGKLLFGLKWWLRQACYYSFFFALFFL
jgi:hypothetical protein